MSIFGKLSENSDTYLKSDSYRSEIWTFRPFASASKVSIRGLVRPDMISDIDDLGMPVRISTCRVVKFFALMISPSNIFIVIAYAISYMDISGKY